MESNYASEIFQIATSQFWYVFIPQYKVDNYQHFNHNRDFPGKHLWLKLY